MIEAQKTDEAQNDETNRDPDAEISRVNGVIEVTVTLDEDTVEAVARPEMIARNKASDHAEGQVGAMSRDTAIKKTWEMVSEGKVEYEVWVRF
jgi:hypothetical protein